MKTILQIIQACQRRLGLSVPDFVIGNPDSSIVQLLGLMQEQLDDLVEYDLPQLQVLASVTANGLEDQGSLETIIPGAVRIIPNTMWNTTTTIQFFGDVGIEQRQLNIARGSVGPYSEYLQINGNLHFTPVATAGDVITFACQSNRAVLALDGTTTKQYFTLDTDTPILPDAFLQLGLIYRWKAIKNLPHRYEYELYNERLQALQKNSRNAPKLHMAGIDSSRVFGIIVPQTFIIPT